jgi:hypothetical protein
MTFDIGQWAIVCACMSPIWGTLLWQTWNLSIWPRLIPAGNINALADNMIAKYGPRAEELAFIEEDRAWRYSETFEQGKWRRVRRELWRRYEAGEWEGPEAGCSG